MNKLLILGCKTLREGVLVSAVFFIGAVLLMIAAQKIVPEVWHMQHLVMAFGLVLMLLAPVVLISTFLLSVFPGAKEKFDQCEH